MPAPPLLAKAFVVLAVLTAFSVPGSGVAAATSSASASEREAGSSARVGHSPRQRSARCRKGTRRVRTVRGKAVRRAGSGGGRTTSRVRSSRRRRAARPSVCARRSKRPPRAPAPAPTPEPAPAPAPAPAPSSGSTLFVDDFTGPDALITNHYAYWNGWDSLRSTDANWAVESGSMFRRDSSAWTGVPDNVYSHNRDSTNGTGSQIFRAWSKRSDFASVKVEFDLKNNGFTNGSSDRPAQQWDGVKVWLHHRYDSMGYAVEVNRRQGNVIIQKKVPASNADGYAYHVLCNTPWSTNPNPARVGAWERVGAVARNNADGSVTLQVLRSGGQVALQCVDNGQVGGAPLRSGDIGVRGDNTDFQFDHLTVTGV